jgi:hypothetical protein
MGSNGEIGEKVVGVSCDVDSFVEGEAISTVLREVFITCKSSENFGDAREL